MSILTDTQTALLQQRMAAAGLAASAPTPDPVAAPTAADGHLGTAESRMWKIYQIDPDSDSHNFTVELSFGPPYTAVQIAASTARIIASSAVVNSVIEETDDGPRRRPQSREGRWVQPDQVWEFGNIAADVDAAASDIASQTFDLTREQPWRVRIRALEDGTVSMVLVIHHIGGDETILPPVLGALVSGRTASWAGGGTAADPSQRTSAHIQAALTHAWATWAGSGIGYPLSGELPATTPEQSWVSVMGEGPGARLRRPVSAAAVARLGELAKKVGATPNALFVAVSALTVAAVTGAHDFVILVPADNRAPTETVDRVGYSGNIVPMRFTFDGSATVGNSLRSAVEVVFTAMEHAAVDYGTILTALRQAGGRFPVAEVMTLVKNAPLRGIAIPEGVDVTCATVVTDTVHYRLSLAFEFDERDAVHLDIEYRTDALTHADADRVADTAGTVIAALPESTDLVLNHFFQLVAG